jgi:hypothetical protein
MKKLIAAFAIAMFLGGISAPVLAVDHSNMVQVVLNDEEPKKADKKEDKAKKEATESSTKTKKKDCSKTCEGDKS